MHDMGSADLGSIQYDMAFPTLWEIPSHQPSSGAPRLALVQYVTQLYSPKSMYSEMSGVSPVMISIGFWPLEYQELLGVKADVLIT